MRWRGRVILQLRCAVEAARLYCEGRTRTCRRGTCPNIGEDQFSTFLAGKHAKVSPAAEPQSFTEVECLGSQPLGMVSRLLRQPLYGFVVESQSPLRLDTSALWRRCLFSLGGGPLARAKLQRYPLSYARLAHTLKIRLKKTWPCREGSRDIGTFHASSPKAQADLAGNQKES
jgi:hypothetical protein